MTLSDRVIVMRDGRIAQMGTPQEIYEDPVSKFVAGFVGKVAFFPVELVENQSSGGKGSWICRLENKTIQVNRFAENVKMGGKVLIMARPESLRLTEPGMGAVEGSVKMNVYLGHSVETFVETPHGEVLIQIDDPASKKLYQEGAKVSIEFNRERIRLLMNE